MFILTNWIYFNISLKHIPDYNLIFIWEYLKVNIKFSISVLAIFMNRPFTNDSFATDWLLFDKDVRVFLTYKLSLPTSIIILKHPISISYLLLRTSGWCIYLQHLGEISGIFGGTEQCGRSEVKYIPCALVHTPIHTKENVFETDMTIKLYFHGVRFGEEKI